MHLNAGWAGERIHIRVLPIIHVGSLITEMFSMLIRPLD